MIMWASAATAATFLALVRRGYCRLESLKKKGFLQAFCTVTGCITLVGAGTSIVITGSIATIHCFLPFSEDHNISETAFQIFVHVTGGCHAIGLLFGIFQGLIEEAEAAGDSRKAAKEAAGAEAADAIEEIADEETPKEVVIKPDEQQTEETQ